MTIVRLWLPPIIWAAVIFTLSGIPDLKSDFEYDFTLRKIAHMLEYAVLTGLLYRACKGSFALSAPALTGFSFGLAFLYAISDEFHQSFVGGRHGAPEDVLIDSIGIAGFLIARHFISQYNRKT